MFALIIDAREPFSFTVMPDSTHIVATSKSLEFLETVQETFMNETAYLLDTDETEIDFHIVPLNPASYAVSVLKALYRSGKSLPVSHS